jgi:hypothetical protein
MVTSNIVIKTHNTIDHTSLYGYWTEANEYLISKFGYCGVFVQAEIYNKRITYFEPSKANYSIGRFLTSDGGHGGSYDFATVWDDLTSSLLDEVPLNIRPDQMSFIGRDFGPGWKRWNVHCPLDGYHGSNSLITKFDDPNEALIFKLIMS